MSSIKTPFFVAAVLEAPLTEWALKMDASAPGAGARWVDVSPSHSLSFFIYGVRGTSQKNQHSLQKQNDVFCFNLSVFAQEIRPQTGQRAGHVQELVLKLIEGLFCPKVRSLPACLINFFSSSSNLGMCNTAQADLGKYPIIFSCSLVEITREKCFSRKLLIASPSSHVVASTTIGSN